MNRDELRNRLVLMAERDAEYQRALQDLQAAEPAYLALLETLEPEKREILERYITACEMLDDSMLVLAYHIGQGFVF